MKRAFMTLMMVALLSACAPASNSIPTPTPIPVLTTEPTVMPTLTTIPSPESATASTVPTTEQPVVVAFVKDGNILLWDEATGQAQTIVNAGDVTTVKMSDDGQVIAFVRRVLVEQQELVEYVALWAVDRDGKNPRELISADSLRQRLNPEPRDSAGFAQIDWIPGTHRLVYNASKHYLPGQGFALSPDIYSVDADTGADTVLAADIMPDTPFINAWSFVLSPDGQRIALFSATELSLINVDGSNWRQAVLTYPAVGMGDAVLLPRGVWTEDSSAFLFTGPTESASPFVLNYTIWRVPADGSQPQSLTTITDSHSNYITFSPDGQRMVFFQDINGDGVIQTEDHRIMTLTAGVGPLALPSSHELVHWSPDGQAFVVKDQDLFRLCPGATNLSEVCGDPIPLASGSNLIDGIEWVDEDRFLYRVLEPTTLFLGRLDGTITPIVTSTEEESLDGWSLYAP